MKMVHKVFGLKEEQIIRQAWLSSDGIKTETEIAVTRHHMGDFEDIFKATDAIKNSKHSFEHGFEIVCVIIKN